MRFMMMIKSDARSEAGQLPEQAMLAEMGKFNVELAGAGLRLACEGLQPSAKGARVRRKGDTFTVVDGPFAEAKELVAGFWLVRAPTLDEAVGWAKRVPCVEEGEIELRRLWEMSDFPAPEAGEPAAKGDDWREFEGRFREQHGQGETGEMIAGYLWVLLPALADAIAVAKRWLAIHVETGRGLDAGEIEIRQVFEMADLPDDTSDSGWRAREEKLRAKREGRLALANRTCRGPGPAWPGRTRCWTRRPPRGRC